MLFLFKISMPVEAGNVQARKGFDTLQRILAEQKPEAIYFATDGGKRTAFMFKSMTDMSELPGIAEPWFLGLNASMDVMPAMTPQDLMKAGPSIGQAVKNYGG
jgi:hypothetical protein